MARELAERTDGGALVRLLWQRDEDTIRIEYYDLHTGEAFTAPVPKAEAKQAFDHPHAYRPHGAVVARPVRDRPGLVGVAAGADSVWDSRHEVDGPC